MEQKEIPKYATLFYDVRAKLDVSPAEYWLLEMVYHLSHKTGYCYKTAGSIAFDLGLTKQGANKMIRRLCERGLLERLTDNAVRVTDRYYSVQSLTGNKVSTYRKSGNKVTKVETKLTDRKLSSPKNNSKNNIEKPASLKKGAGFQKYMDKRKQLFDTNG